MKIFKRAAVCVVGSVALAVGSTLPAQASLAQPKVVSDNPADTSPQIVMCDTSFDVRAFAQVGNTVYAGGRFDQVQDPAFTTTYDRQNFVAFDAQTGVISPINLSFDGMVAADPGSRRRERALHRWRLLTCQRADPPGDDEVRPGQQPDRPDLRADGDADRVRHQPRQRGRHRGGELHEEVDGHGPDDRRGHRRHQHHGHRRGRPGQRDQDQYIAVSPDGTRLVATGNFTTVNGASRRRAFELDLGATATLSTWHAPRFDVDCVATSRLISAQGVDFSPDGSYFVIVATGGPTGTNGICDAAARFETANVSANVQPTWINWTGGDTLYSVAVTGAAVYVGGHQRWLDNPLGHDSAGPGAVSRPGHRRDRPGDRQGAGLESHQIPQPRHKALFATRAGLWVGSDGTSSGTSTTPGSALPRSTSAPCPTDPAEHVHRLGPSGTVIETSAFFTFSATEPRRSCAASTAPRSPRAHRRRATRT